MSKREKVVVLWDLDNKPPCDPPYLATMALKEVTKKFEEVVNISAYADRQACGGRLGQGIRETCGLVGTVGGS